MPDYRQLREQMVAKQIVRRGITDPALLAAMRTVPRERFVGEAVKAQAYDDRPLPIGAGQTISQPYIVAAMIEGIGIGNGGIGAGDRVLEVGAGSGYAAAILGRIAGQVFAIERHASLAGQARRRMRELGYANVDIREGDGTLGLAGEAPFDAILVSACGPDVPSALKTQLAVGGRLVMPVGGEVQRLCRITRLDDDHYEVDWGEAVTFVPLIGKQGWLGI
ncbi:protein-L-isoaspartate(D-aspartate) O-methyltransferase [Sphingobium chungbukense]|uniref:Protein-L-isoaspartate O-methyltransferase n=1 Tax=Sphingobium chungbukense TaxID=56193 RepID=A0A0M3ARI7_9SPHN|nr:protein-L-isoaspartate(D-aspartate) O-methyltransferase [Sphingobium chungbukense]KKW91531.1 protein-L-isoaspartate O-methyltransferase [Sphingobium chungbukense]